MSRSPSDVVVRLAGYKNGQLVRERCQKLKDLLDPSVELLEAGKNVRIHVSLPLADATDYQIGLLWGKDAKEIVQLEVRNQRLEEGACEGCPKAILFDLVNVGTKTAIAATLGIEWPGKVASPGKNEEHIDASELNLAPGEVRAVRLVIEDLVIEGQGTLPGVPQISLIESR